jgi:vitamin B12/bleomycin/antimicrobial peptide transport system ATP-binding/permease protein
LGLFEVGRVEAEDGAGGSNGRDRSDVQGRIGFLRKVWRLASAYYSSEERRSAWAITAVVVVLTLLQIAVQVRFNIWNRDFFDALDKRDHERFLWQMGLFVVLALAGTAAAIFQMHARQTLQVWWRDWLVRHLQGRMLAGSAHYRMQFVEGAADNPDQRIGENARWATATAVELAVGLLNSVVLLAAFVGILWTLSGPLDVSVAGKELEIPGYMVFAALFYAATAAAATWLVGRRMPDINARRNEVEGDHRFALVRLRENSEGVAMIRGEADEERGLKRAFGRVTGVMKELNRAERNLVGLSSAFGMVVVVFPILVASPRYFAGAITLGVLMQVGQAFGEVTKALNWFMDNYPKLADWTSHVDRVVELEDSLDASGCVDRQCALDIEEMTGGAGGGEDAVSLQGVAVATPGGKPLVRRADAVIRPGERVLIQGESGTGKSTLFRALAGAWPWGTGRIRVPDRSTAMFLPQRPYLPLGMLRDALSYPNPAKDFDDAALTAALARCGLDACAKRLDDEERWDRVLSLGEQQRLAFARTLLHRPRWIFLDEATAALDEENQDAMMEMLRDELPETAVISIGHRPGLERHHDRVLVLEASPEGAVLADPEGADDGEPPRSPPPAGPTASVRRPASSPARCAPCGAAWAVAGTERVAEAIPPEEARTMPSPPPHGDG